MSLRSEMFLKGDVVRGPAKLAEEVASAEAAAAQVEKGVRWQQVIA
jgi:hypothetical protein